MNKFKLNVVYDSGVESPHVNSMVNPYYQANYKDSSVEAILSKNFFSTEPTREAVKEVLEDVFINMLITVGGCHVAVHDTAGNRMFIVVSDAPDFN